LEEEIVLFIVKMSFFIFFSSLTSMTYAKEQACNLNHDLSWTRELNLQAKKLSQTHQAEARIIVETAIRTATESNSCAIAKELVDQGKEIGRKSLNSPTITATRNENTVRTPKLLVFVSFSMPLESLKALGAQVNRVGGKLVLRGLIKGSFQETALKIQELQEEVVIDPPLFEAYQIEHVPTFILRNTSTERVEEDVMYDQLSGNVSLIYALEQFASEGEVKQEAATLIKAIRGIP